ncbi:Glu/Leu/Phe/Val family dehydrogenase [Rhodococcus koreensis]
MTLTSSDSLGDVDDTFVFDRLDFVDSPHEQVVFCQDAESGLKAIIAIHSTVLGPALGGTRFYPFVDERAALTDALRLSKGMTYKAAAAGLRLGGGKAVIIGDPRTLKSEALLAAYGRFVETLNGRYITAGDVGTTADDMDVVGKYTDHVTGRTIAAGGSGDSAPLTALGVFHSMRAAAASTWGSPDLAGRRVGVEGTGKVGYHLIRLLTEAGASVVACDINAEALNRATQNFPDLLPATGVIASPLDIYAPCALGATLSHQSVRDLSATIVCGAANNQLADPSVEQSMAEQGITWVPDFVANAGGLIQMAGELAHKSAADVTPRVEKIFDTVHEILEVAAIDGVSTGVSANRVADARIHAARH